MLCFEIFSHEDDAAVCSITMLVAVREQNFGSIILVNLLISIVDCSISLH